MEPLAVASTAWGAAVPRPAATARQPSTGREDLGSHYQGALQRLRQVVDSCCEQLGAIATARHEGGEALVRRVQDVTRVLEAEAREALAAGPMGARAASRGRSGSPSRNCDVLKQSLQEAQRRCESLNGGMLRQAEANEELVQSLGTGKDTNRRLLEQIRAQTDEIARLTQQRVANEERMDELVHRHRADRDAFDLDSRHQLLAAQETANQRYSQMYNQLADKYQLICTRLGSAKKDVVWLNQQGLEINNATEMARQQLAAAEEGILRKVAAYQRQQEGRASAVEADVEDLARQLQQEAAARQQESATWAQKQAVLTTDCDDLQACASRELEQLSARLQAVNRAALAERSVGPEEIARYEKELDRQLARQREYESAMDQVTHEVARLEAANNSMAAENRMKAHALEDLQRQIRESGDALAAAASGNEHLREQMDEHLLRYGEMNESELSTYRTGRESAVAKAREAHAADVGATQEQIRAAEAEMAAQGSDITKLNSQIQLIDAESDALRRELDAWKAQYSKASSARQELEDLFAQGRKDFASEKLRLQTSIDQAGPRNAAAEAEIRMASKRLAEDRRLALTRGTEQASRISELEDLLKNTQSQLVDARARLAEATDALKGATADAEVHHQRAVDTQAGFESELEQKRREIAAELQLLEDQLVADRQTAMVTQAQSEQWREAQQQGLRQLREECSARVALLEKEKLRADERHGAEMAQARKDVEQQRKHFEGLEQDLQHVKTLLSESQANLGWARQEREREEREAKLTRERLEDELRQVSGTLSLALSSEEQAEPVAAAPLGGLGGSLAQEAADLRQRCSIQQQEVESRLRRVKLEHEVQLAAVETDHREAMDRAGVKLDAMMRENEDLRARAGPMPGEPVVPRQP